MGRKSNKAQTPPPPPPLSGKRPFGIVLGATVGALAILIGGLVFWRQEAPPAAPHPAPAAVPAVAEVPEINKRPHPNASTPPLRFPGYAMPRPPEAVQAAYKFAAEHPEVLSYMPCFCGCERSGHRGNEDCFVKGRDIDGNVIEWDDHGMECAICLDVAIKSLELHASGASIADIRAAIEKEWGTRATNHTPTPHPPHN